MGCGKRLDKNHIPMDEDNGEWGGRAEVGVGTGLRGTMRK